MAGVGAFGSDECRGPDRSTAWNFKASEVPHAQLVITENITLDGVIDMTEGWFDPLNEDADQSDITAANAQHQAAADAPVPQRGGQVRGLQNHGLSRVGELHRAAVQALIDARLVDEYRLFVFPLVVGRGTRLFEAADIKLRLLETRPFVSGAVLLRYATAD
jgi:RibD C-terminal domain